MACHRNDVDREATVSRVYTLYEVKACGPRLHVAVGCVNVTFLANNQVTVGIHPLQLRRSRVEICGKET